MLSDVYVRSAAPSSFGHSFTHKSVFYKKGMIKYHYSGPGKLDKDTKWMKAPLKWRRSHRRKR